MHRWQIKHDYTIKLAGPNFYFHRKAVPSNRFLVGSSCGLALQSLPQSGAITVVTPMEQKPKRESLIVCARGRHHQDVFGDALSEAQSAPFDANHTRGVATGTEQLQFRSWIDSHGRHARTEVTPPRNPCHSEPASRIGLIEAQAPTTTVRPLAIRTVVFQTPAPLILPQFHFHSLRTTDEALDPNLILGNPNFLRSQ